MTQEEQNLKAMYEALNASHNENLLEEQVLITQYNKLTSALQELRQIRKTRELAIVITELEKLIAYYKIFVLN